MVPVHQAILNKWTRICIMAGHILRMRKLIWSRGIGAEDDLDLLTASSIASTSNSVMLNRTPESRIWGSRKPWRIYKNMRR